MANTDPITTTQTDPSAALWRIVVSEYEQAWTQFKANWAAYEAAEEAANEECPLRHDFHDVYGLRVYMTREEALETVDAVITARDGLTDDALTEEVIDRQADEAQQIVDEFFAYLRTREECETRHRLNELRNKHREYCHSAFYPAREKLFATPAPDVAAVLVKARVVASAVDEGEGLEADLNRLLGAVA
jgi:hypothetical protein